MKNKKRTALFLIFFLLFMPQAAQAAEGENPPSPNELHASSALVMDGKSGRVLYEKNGYEVMPMASTTKIMTCLYALEHGDLSAETSISEKAPLAPPVKLGLVKGDTYRLMDLLYSLMLESHNDTAVAVAEAVEGSVESFCKKMTKEARSFGCNETCFETPNGLDSQNHHTTAYELGLIAKKALENETFREIIRTPSYEFSTTDGKKHHAVTNHDGFLSRYDGAIGVKTGFTGKAGYCFVGAVESEDRLFISVVLACGWPPHKTWKWADTKKLMDYACKNYRYQPVLSPGSHPLPVLPVKRGLKKKCGLFYRDFVTLLAKESDEVTIEENLPASLTAPVKQNEPIGSLDVYLNGDLYTSVPVYTKSSSKEIDLRYCLKHIFHLYWHCLTYEGVYTRESLPIKAFKKERNASISSRVPIVIRR